MCPSKHRHGAILYAYSEKPPHLVAFYDTLGIRKIYSYLKPRVPKELDRLFNVTINEFVFIVVFRHMERYFSYICDGIDVQADWRISCTYGRAPNAIDLSQCSLTCQSYTDTGPPFLYGDSDTKPL